MRGCRDRPVPGVVALAAYDVLTGDTALRADLIFDGMRGLCVQTEKVRPARTRRKISLPWREEEGEGYDDV